MSHQNNFIDSVLIGHKIAILRVKIGYVRDKALTRKEASEHFICTTDLT